jgi:hypothetical protein
MTNEELLELKPNMMFKTDEFLGIVVTDPKYYNQMKLTGNIPSVRFTAKVIGPVGRNRFFDEDYQIGQVVEVDEGLAFAIRNWSLID